MAQYFSARALTAMALTLTLAACSGSSSPSATSTTPPPTQPGNPVGSNLTQVSSDPFTVGPGQHATEVEPHMLSNGSTLVAAFQTGRISPGGATDIGWATSTDGGTTWSHGFLPGLTKGEGSGPYDAASDPAVAYDAKHAVWMISSLPLSNSSATPAVVVSRSTDGGFTWQSPVSVDATSQSSDKNWIACDSWLSSPHYGNCYMEWDDPLNSDEIVMSTSSDGGLTWGPVTPTANLSNGIGGQPLVQPSGNVVVPIESTAAPLMLAYSSSDGGVTWSAPVTISTYPVSFGCGRNSQRSVAVGCGGWSWNDLGRVGGLPFSRKLYDERSGLQHVDGRSELGSGDENPDRRCVELRGSFHSGDRHRSGNFWSGGARGAALLLLFAEQLYGGNMPAGGGIHFFGEWRDELE